MRPVLFRSAENLPARTLLKESFNNLIACFQLFPQPAFRTPGCTQIPSDCLDPLKYRRLVMDFLWFLIVGGMAGWLAGMVMKGKGFGIFGNIIVGIIGGLIGGFVFGLLGISTGGLIGALITAFIGAVLLIYIIGLIKK